MSAHFESSAGGSAEGEDDASMPSFPPSVAAAFGRPLLSLSSAELLCAITTVAGRHDAPPGSRSGGGIDGVGSAAKFGTLGSIAVTRDGKFAYVADRDNRRICLIDLKTQNVTTIAGGGVEGSDSDEESSDSDEESFADGFGTAASFCDPCGLALSPEEDKLYVSEFRAGTIRCIWLNDNMRVVTIAGSAAAIERSLDGAGTEAIFEGPTSLAISSDGEKLYVADILSWEIRCIALNDNMQVVTIAGVRSPGSIVDCHIARSVDGIGRLASFNLGACLTLSPCEKKLFVADVSCIRCVELQENMRVTTIAGHKVNTGYADGKGTVARFKYCTSMAVSPKGDELFVCDCAGHKLRSVSLHGDHLVTTIAGNGSRGGNDGDVKTASLENPLQCTLAPDGSLYMTTMCRTVRKVTFRQQHLPIVVPPSTLTADFARLVTDASLPRGHVAFNVGFPGEPKKMTTEIGRNILCVRSPYFASMFAQDNFTTQNVVDVDDCDYATFQAMLVYLTKDTVEFSHDDAAGAFELLKLARKHGLTRLEALCTQLLDRGGKLLTPGSAVPLLEGVVHHVREDDGRLFDTHRAYMLGHGDEVVKAGGLDQLQELAVTKGLLMDAYAEVDRLRGDSEVTKGLLMDAYAEMDRMQRGSETGGERRKRRRTTE
jgi:DNA-binding beta-propeller fold protein YncE